MFGSFNPNEVVALKGYKEVIWSAKGLDAKITESGVMGGVCIRMHFDNGLGASVAQHSASYGGRDGLWEIAPLILDEIIPMRKYDDDGNFVKESPTVTKLRNITGADYDSVAGWISTEYVIQMLNKIAFIDYERGE